jgi:hypothetical protein
MDLNGTRTLEFVLIKNLLDFSNRERYEKNVGENLLHTNEMRKTKVNVIQFVPIVTLIQMKPREVLMVRESSSES